MPMRPFIIITLVFLSFVSYGQSKKKKKRSEKETTENAQPTSLNPQAAEKKYEGKKSRKGQGTTTYNAEQDYYERLAYLEKERRKNEKNMDKPQYSDPMYFGHKRPPKKRAPNKMKFCKVCGIRH